MGMRFAVVCKTRLAGSPDAEAHASAAAICQSQNGHKAKALIPFLCVCCKVFEDSRTI